MSDNYEFCPCGSGKKVKFCCCKDVAKDLAKLKRALEGEQRAAGLDRLDQLLKSKGPRSGLLVMKANLALEMQQFEQARSSVDTLLAHDDKCAAGYALRALLRHVMDEEGEELQAAVDDLQSSLECTSRVVSLELFNILGVIGEGLLETGHYCEALGHFLVQLSFGNEQMTQGFENFTRVTGSPNIALAVKAIVHQAQAHSVKATEPVSDLWSGVYSGRWRLVKADLLKSNLATTDNDALRLLATVESFLGNLSAAVVAWRELGRRLEDRYLAAEALAIAQGLDPHQDEIDMSLDSFMIVDLDRIMEFLDSHPQTLQIEMDPEEENESTEPPEIAQFRVLDRPHQKSIEDGELTFENSAKVLGVCRVYGKQTDQDARLVLNTDELHQEVCKQLLVDVCGESLGALTESEVIGKLPREAAESSIQVSLPDDATNLDRERIQIDSQGAIFRNFAEFPRPWLDGKSICQAAGDPVLTAEVEAALLRVTVASQLAEHVRELMDELKMEPLTAPDVVIGESHVSLFHLQLLDPAKLDDDQLLHAFRDASGHRAASAIRTLSPVVIERLGSELEDVDRVYQELISVLLTSADKLQWIQKAIEATRARGDSPAEWLFVELDLRLQRGEGKEAMETVQTLHTKHANEPGIGQRLFQVLYSLGLVTPDGQMVDPSGGNEPEGVITADSTGTEAGQLWTGDEDSVSTGDSGEEKGKLWLPGMD